MTRGVTTLLLSHTQAHAVINEEKGETKEEYKVTVLYIYVKQKRGAQTALRGDSDALAQNEILRINFTRVFPRTVRGVATTPKPSSSQVSEKRLIRDYYTTLQPGKMNHHLYIIVISPCRLSKM